MNDVVDLGLALRKATRGGAYVKANLDAADEITRPPRDAASQVNGIYNLLNVVHK